MRIGTVLTGVAVLLAASGSGASVPAAPTRSVGAAPARLPRAAAALTYSPPTVAPLVVVRPFDAPAGPYGPGHRGVDLDLVGSPTVRAAADGTVSFAGPVAGRGVVVVMHPDGIRTEYEPVSASVRVGMTVARGDPLGRVSGRHAGCAAVTCLHWGARRGATYLDPLSLLRPLGPVRLLPWPRDG